ncbi:response regulator [Epibacterium sp. SM1969]|uniref:Response regulator n=1 Tax=Tritonibacter aquimaris TaxID=2663379 RepID=A0A844ALU5_9RHOB|nr:response regulator [Tritonibacter aquimaris]MQY42759.1 response regulator [Tritonibacter aquimaris]
MAEATTENYNSELTVLLVDDDKEALEELQDIIELEGWNSIIAGDVDMALEVLEWYPYIGVVVSDVHFMDPDGDTSSGFQLVSRAKARFPDRDLAFILSSGDPWAFKGTEQIGAVDFLSKPLVPDDLIDSVKSFAGRGAAVTNNPDRDENLLQKVQQTAQALHERGTKKDDDQAGDAA